MHHPHQFSTMAKSIQNDRLKEAAASRAAKEARQGRSSQRLRFVSISPWRELQQVIGRAVDSIGILNQRFTGADHSK